MEPQGLPEEFLDRMKKMLGEEYPAFLESYAHPNRQSLRVNVLKGEKEDFLQKTAFGLTPVKWEENGFYYEAADQPGRHPWHEAGVYYIQEASAMAPAVYLGARPGERVLDLCAAPGGKSGQIAAAMEQRGILVLNEIHPGRARILSENVERMGIANAIVTNAAPEELADRFPGWFDRILVDAPCSGEGMFRKTPEACREWSAQNVEMCAKRQDGILDSAALMLRAGGRLVYSTCTFAPSEDEGSVLRFLLRHPDFALRKVPLSEGMEKGRPAWGLEGLSCSGTGGLTEGKKAPDAITEQLSYTVRLWPHRLAGEGHYVAVFQKEGEASLPGRENMRYGEEKDLKPREYAAYTQFARENLRCFPEGIHVNFGEQLYLAPWGTPVLKGLKVLRPGLHLGAQKKGRFEPSHALALFLKPKDVLRRLDLPANGTEIKGWLAGETLPASGEKGWYLITADGYSVGWGKLAGGQMKNHYPRGLRKNY